MTTGQIIKLLREERGMTQEQLAELMGYSHKSSINKIELGKADLPQSKIVAFAKVFGVTPCEIIGYEPQKATEEQKKAWDEKLNAGQKLQSEVQVIEAFQKMYGKDAVKLMQLFNQLNDQGKKRAIQTVSDLIEIEKYTENSD